MGIQLRTTSVQHFWSFTAMLKQQRYHVFWTRSLRSNDLHRQPCEYNKRPSRRCLLTFHTVQYRVKICVFVRLHSAQLCYVLTLCSNRCMDSPKSGLVWKKK